MSEQHGEAPGHEDPERGGEHAPSGHGEHHQEFNWAYGFLGEKEGAEPNLLWREPGTPAPFGALVLNTALLAFLFVRFGRRMVDEGLKKRRTSLLAAVDAASAMEKEARSALDEHRNKLDNLDAEIQRLKTEMRETAERERKRVLAEAEQRRKRLEREASTLVQQELEAAKEALLQQTAKAAVEEARRLLSERVSADDHRRICDAFLRTLPGKQPPSSAPQPVAEARVSGGA